MLNRRNILINIVIFCVFSLHLQAQNIFIENKGQFPDAVKAKVNLPSGALFIEGGKLIYNFYSGKQLADIHDLKCSKKYVDAHAFKSEFINCTHNVSTKLYGESRYYENYFLGPKSNWARGVKSYKSLYQTNVYPGIDVHYYINKDKFKYDIIVAPKSEARQIKIKYTGLNKIVLDDESGDLTLATTVNTLKERKPYAYQIINGEQIIVSCIYILKRGLLSFGFPEGYDHNYELIIDPVLEFSTYSGSTTDNFGYTATYDDLGFLYAGSTAFGAGYPTTTGAYQINYANTSGGTDVVVTKYDTSGTQRIYSTYLGGTNDELPHSMIVNTSNELFVFGTTSSPDFPTTTQAFQQNFIGGPPFIATGIGATFPNGSDLFVSRISADGGSLLASTFVGGSDNDGLNTSSMLKYNYADEVRGEIDIDDQNNLYIATCTNSNDFPVISSFETNFQGGQEGCIIKMDNQLTSIIWSAYLGGTKDDAIYSLALDENNDIYVTGGTGSLDFPCTASAYQAIHQDSSEADAFITKISANGAAILASSYFGTPKYDQSYFVEIGKDGSVYFFGQTAGTGLQLVNNANYSVLDGGQFIAIFNEDLSSVLRSTVVGTGKGTPDISPTAFLVDVCNKIYIAGWGSALGGPLSTLNLTITDGAYQKSTDGNDVYLMVLDEVLDTIIYATYFGGSQSSEHVDGGTSRFDKKGIIYQSVCAGCGGNSDFPIEPNPGAVASINNSSNCNNGVFKFNFDFPMILADFKAPWVGCDMSISFQNLSYTNTTANYTWDFGDGSFSNDINPTHNFMYPGKYNITLIANDNSACNVADTIVKQVYILSNNIDTLDNINKCLNDQVQIGLPPINDTMVTYFWSPNINLNSLDIANPYCNTNTNQQYQLLISNGNCTDTLVQTVLVNDLELEAGIDTSYCNTPILLKSTFSNSTTSIFWSSNDNFTDTLSASEDLVISNAGTFYVVAYNDNCKQIDSIQVFSESIDIEAYASDVCIGDSTLVGVNNLSPTTPIISYTWNITGVDTAKFIFFPDSSMWYVVEATNKDSCVARDSVFINVYSLPSIDSISVSDSIVFEGESIELNVVTQDDIVWADFTSSNKIQSVSAIETKCYQFEVFNPFNCRLQDSICIQVQDVFCDDKNIIIPNAFSPNNDGVNDFYYIKDEDGIIRQFKLEIFNRLGQRVFSSSDIYKKWDGTFKGKKLPPQVFDFYFESKCVGGKTLFYKGNITLIR